jgi:hypothetical protein
MDKFVKRLTPAEKEAQDKQKWEACNKEDEDGDVME